MMDSMIAGRAFTAVLLGAALYGQELIPVDPAISGGNEGKLYFSKIWGNMAVTNVERPTIQVFLPESGKGTGAGVIIAPGGAYHALAIDKEGTQVAEWLAARGVAGFVLRYRVVPAGDDGVAELTEKLKDPRAFGADKNIRKYIALGVQDGLAALAFVKKNAAKWAVDPNRVGIMGFSAGGTVTAGAMFAYSAETRPAFGAPVYGAMAGLLSRELPADAAPLFLAHASDDRLVPAAGSIRMYEKWLAGKKPAELHIYAKGGHGFGMRKAGLPSDGWVEAFHGWLQQQGFLRQ